MLTLPLMTHTASTRLAKSLYDDVEVRDALASLITGCYSTVLFCSETITDHCVQISDREPCDAIMHHLFSGLCAVQPNVPACRAIARRQRTCKSLIDYVACSPLHFPITIYHSTLSVYAVHPLVWIRVIMDVS